MHKSVIAGVEAIIYSNSTKTDQASAITTFLNSISEHQVIHIYTYGSTEKMWVFSSRTLTPMVLGDIYADEWVDQTQVQSDDIPSMIELSLNRPDYADGIANDLNKYLSHRRNVLAGLMESLCLDLGRNKEPWSPVLFAQFLKLLGKNRKSKRNNLISFVGHTPPLIQRVICVAFAIK